jgi:transcriptional regulator with XRE-family HTH domain
MTNKTTKPATTITPATKTRPKKRQTLSRTRLSYLIWLCCSTNGDVAKRIGLSPTLLSSISTGMTTPSQEMCERLGRHFNVSPDRILDPIFSGPVFRALEQIPKAA